MGLSRTLLDPAMKPPRFSEPVLSPVRFKHVTKTGISGFFEDIKLWRFSMRLWRLREDWIFYCEYLKCWAKIPAGFVFDGASVPKVFHSIINSTDSLFYGAIVHDMVYRCDQLIICTDEDYGRWAVADNVSKETADILLKEVSIQADGVQIPVHIAYAVIVPTGIFAWNRARKRNLKLDTPYPTPDNIILTKGLVF